MIFNNLKKPESRATKEEMRAMIGACDLVPKARAKAKTLSGGQKRKLQLAMMFAGGSSVCCIDEVSSGLDPLSRRKIWDILLAERGDRTIIMTTHFLDEADFLSDHIAILSKGTLVAEGPSISLKHRYGDGLSFHIPRNANATVMPDVLGVSKVESTTETVYTVSNYDHAAKFIKALDKHGIVDYKVSGPTLENVFLQLVDEHACRKVSEGVQLAAVSSQTPEYQNHGHVVKADATSAPRIKLHQGKHIGPLRQGWVLFRKRMTISGRNYLPTLGAVAIALIGAGASQLLLKDYEGIECASALDVTASQTDDSYNLATEGFSHLVAGPSSKITDDKFANLAQIYSANHTKWGYGIDDVKSVMQGIHTVSTSNEFYDYITTQDGTLEPGGIFLGDDSVAPQFAWLADPFNLHNGLVMQNMLNNILSNVSIFTSYAGFENPPSPELFHFSALIFCMYMGLVLACYPAIFALYPTAERLRNVRALHYSNGVRPVPLWLAHLAFDSVIVLAISFLVTALFSTGVSIWYVFLLSHESGLSSLITTDTIFQVSLTILVCDLLPVWCCFDPSRVPYLFDCSFSAGGLGIVRRWSSAVFLSLLRRLYRYSRQRRHSLSSVDIQQSPFHHWHHISRGKCPTFFILVPESLRTELRYRLEALGYCCLRRPHLISYHPVSGPSLFATLVRQRYEGSATVPKRIPARRHRKGGSFHFAG